MCIGVGVAAVGPGGGERLVVGGDELVMVLGPDPVVSAATYNMDVGVNILKGKTFP